MKKLIILTLFPFILLSQENYMWDEYLDIDTCLDVHNKARAEVGVNKLLWSPELANDAQKYAEELANKDSMVHSEENNGQGENLYYSYKSKTLNGVKSFEFSETPFTDASNAWYGEIVDYSYGPIKNDSHFYKIGHYTQMIWSTTKEFGMGYAKSKSGKIYVVARYYPQGNYIGEYPY